MHEGAYQGAFATQSEAKRFLIEKIVAQAVAEGTPLSRAQQWMLSFSESDPHFVVDHQLVEEHEAEIDDNAYETKIAGLLKRSYQREVASSTAARGLYRAARARLAEGDHYLLLMVDQALGPVSPGRIVSGPIGFLFLVVPGAIGIAIAVGLAWALLKRGFSAREATDVATVAVMLAVGGVYLMWLWIRERRR
jgi:hypothetical protein